MSAIAENLTPHVAIPTADALFFAHVLSMTRLFEGSAAAQGNGDADPSARPVKVEPRCRQYQRCVVVEQVLGEGFVVQRNWFGGGGRVGRERKKPDRCLQNEQ